MSDDVKKYLYFDIPKQERDSAIGYLLHSLLKSKRDCEHLDHSDREVNEDVNIYLAHLLFAAALPDYQQAIKQYLSTNVSDLAELVEENDDRIIRYFIYKVNADHLLVHLGIFQDLESAKPSGFSKSARQYASMGQSYYKQAAEYNHRIYRRQTAIGSVLEKLGGDFDRYQEILRLARRDFFHFSTHFRDEEFFRFCVDMRKYEVEKQVTDQKDSFLDCYLDWKRFRSGEARRNLIRAAEDLKQIDPDFKFNIEEE